MLVIRKEQIEVLKQVPLAVFKQKMVALLREDFPRDCEILGDEQIRKVLELGIGRAKGYGFDTRGDVCDYIVLMFKLGSFFDEDPLLPWAAELLKGREEFVPSDVIWDLYARAGDYCQSVAGDDGRYYRAALKKFHETPFESFAKAAAGDLTRELGTLIKGLYPQRHQASPEDILEKMGVLGRASAGGYGLETPEGTLLYCVLMFMFGSHFDRDPLHPWAGVVLKHSTIEESGTKARRLHEAAVIRVGQALGGDQ
jgi:hypothetical protein